MNVNTKIFWNDYNNATPIDDLRKWQTDLAYDTGYYPEYLEFGTDVAYNIMKCKNIYGLELISELPDLLFGDSVLNLGLESSNGKVKLYIGKYRDKFIESKVF